MSHSIFVNRGIRAAVPVVAQRVDLLTVDIKARLAQCLPCSWNVGNKCQHPGQSCAPCKQGRGLQAALERASFKCPIGNF